MSSACQPVVLPFAPVAGWRQAGTLQRVLAVTVLPLVALWALLLWKAPALGDAVTATTGVTLGPAAFWSLARVLRPHVGSSVERMVRHAFAATATCLGTAVIIGIAVNTADGDFLWLFVGPASLGLVVTLPWGVTAMVTRAVRTPAPPAAATPASGVTVLPS